MNTKEEKFFCIPIFINSIHLIESKKKNVGVIDIGEIVKNRLLLYFPALSYAEVTDRYKIILLVDSIDEFDKQSQSKIINDLQTFDKAKTQIFLGTRYQDYSVIKDIANLGKCEEIFVEKFNGNQIKSFLASYFKNDVIKADNLLDSLKENSIIQRLPITPLNLSLISILYEENNFEIPATITDIYDNFSNLLLGRSMPDSRLDFFDTTIRERILSSYALELMKKGERSYMTKEEFHSFFTEFFKRISGTIDLELLPAALDYIINNTGILILQDGIYVKFMHESYMEYYASREIFYYQKEIFEPVLIDRFLHINWQYASIFYAGRTKEMYKFLEQIIERTKQSKTSLEFHKSVYGLGYLIQALYLTDNELRKEAILTSLDHLIEMYEWMKKMGADDRFFFKNLSMPLTAIINTMIFFEYHNSITIKRPLQLAFDELKNKLEIKDDLGNAEINSTIAFKMFCLALTLSSPRLSSMEEIEFLIYQTGLLNDPLFERLLDFGVNIVGNKLLYELKDELKRPKRAKIGSNFQFGSSTDMLILTAPIGRFRFTEYDRILPERKVKIITEGKSDAQIIEHAYNILTGEIPYWEIFPIHEVNGGANELAKCLANGVRLADDKLVIGLFDNDEKGIQEFEGELPKSKFEYYTNSRRIKKHREGKIFGLKLPIPPFRTKYYNEQQKFNFFTIEHYFDGKPFFQNMLEQLRTNLY